VALLKRSEKRNQDAELAVWEATRQRVESFLDRAQHFEGFTNTQDPSLALPLHGDERALLVVHGAQLVAPRRLPGHWIGGNTGFTFHVTKGVNYRVGATRGTYVSGEEQPEVVDTGVATFTDHRVVFTGTRHSQEWDFDKVLGYHHDDADSWTAIPVSNRQTVSGLRYNQEHAEEIRFALALGLARFHGSADSLVTDLSMQLSELDRDRPGGTPAATAPADTAPAAAPATNAADEPGAGAVAPGQAQADAPSLTAPGGAQAADAAGAGAPPANPFAAPVAAGAAAGAAGGLQSPYAQPAAAHEPETQEPEGQGSEGQGPEGQHSASTVAPGQVTGQAPGHGTGQVPGQASPDPAAGPQAEDAAAAAAEGAATPVQAETPGRAPTAGAGAAQGAAVAGVAQAGAASGASGGPAPGWYPDPYGAARLRWWDGTTWTGYVSP
jgi:hypothetical protein